MTRASDPVVAQSTASNTTPPRSVIVNGTGRVSVVPDRLFLNLGVETRAPKVADALRTNNKAAQDLIKVLKDKGVAEKDIKTSQLSIYPQFDTTGRRITSYQVNNSVTATIRNIATSGDLIDSAATVAGDAIRINGLDFSVGDPSAALASARDLAVKDAKTQAEQLAKSAGVKLGKLRTISSGSDVSESPVFKRSAAVADSPRRADLRGEPGRIRHRSTRVRHRGLSPSRVLRGLSPSRVLRGLSPSRVCDMRWWAAINAGTSRRDVDRGDRVRPYEARTRGRTSGSLR